MLKHWALSPRTPIRGQHDSIYKHPHAVILNLFQDPFSLIEEAYCHFYLAMLTTVHGFVTGKLVDVLKSLRKKSSINFLSDGALRKFIDLNRCFFTFFTLLGNGMVLQLQAYSHSKLKIPGPCQEWQEVALRYDCFTITQGERSWRIFSWPQVVIRLVQLSAIE